MAPHTRDMLAAFLEEVRTQETPYILEQISKSTDLETLRKYSYSDNTSEIIVGAHKRLAQLIDEKLKHATIDDLPITYHDWIKYDNEKYHEKVDSKAKELYGMISSLEIISALLSEENLRAEGDNMRLVFRLQDRQFELLESCILDRLAQEPTIPELSQYIEIADNGGHYINQIQRTIDEHIAIQIEKAISIDEVFSYKNILRKNHNYYVRADFAIDKKLTSLITVACMQTNSAEETYELYKKTKSEYSQNFLNPLWTKWINLLPEYFKKNNDIQRALVWYREHDILALKGIIANLISNENDPGNLIIFQENDGAFSIAQERYKFLIANLTEPTEHFVNAIEKREFLGCQKVFAQKAKEFLSK